MTHIQRTVRGRTEHSFGGDHRAWLIAKRVSCAAHKAIVVTITRARIVALRAKVDRITWAIDESRARLARIAGCKEEKLRVTGIPIDPMFATPMTDRLSWGGNHGLDAEATGDSHLSRAL